MLCEEFMTKGTCAKKDCTCAHGKAELQTPEVFKGMPGYKACLCTDYILSRCTDANCFCAHGIMDLRRQSLKVPSALVGQQFFFSDSHVHLDHVLLARKYGTYWFHGSQTCRRPNCIFGKNCMFVHKGR